MKRLTICVVNPHKELTVDGYLFKNAQASIGHNLCKPWCDVYALGQSQDIDFVTFDQVKDFAKLDGCMFLDRPFANDPEANALLALPIKKYLVLYESAMIRPDNWEPGYHALFDKVFTWSDGHVDGRKYIKINFSIEPQPLNGFVVDEVRFQHRKLLTLIAGAKTHAHPNELYSHRLTAIRWYEQTHARDFDLYGTGWDAATFPSYRGRVDNKIEVLGNYNFSICYENATNYPGYITEKLLDCLSAQNVAVYGGDTTIGTKIPEKCFIDVRNFKSLPELHSYIKGMPASEYLGYIAEIQKFFANGSVTQFSNPTFANTIVGTVAQDFGGGAIAPVVPVVAAAPAPVPVAPPKPAPKLVVVVGYGTEQSIFTRAKSVWDFHASFFSGFDLYFLRQSTDVPGGQVNLVEGNVIEVGVGGVTVPGHSDTNLYSQTGIWSKTENFLTIYRQMGMYDFLLRQYQGNFHLFNSTVTSVIDFDGVLSALSQLPAERCYAGMPDTLGAPRYTEAPLQGLNLVFGTNTLLSRDVLELARARYVQDDPFTFEPNDVWLSQLLDDIPRQALPFFSFLKYRDVQDPSDSAYQLAQQLNTQGHYQFRVKTAPSTYPPGARREDVDPWIMLSIAKAIVGNRQPKRYAEYLNYFRGAFVGGAENAIPPRIATHVFNGTTAIAWDDTKVS